jgi:hypothetical protein
MISIYNAHLSIRAYSGMRRHCCQTPYHGAEHLRGVGVLRGAGCYFIKVYSY